jgi:hypothetical protein
MAETLVENGICVSCGSAVRQDSSFCFNCGESLIPEPLPPAILKPPTGTLNGRDFRSDKTLEFHEPEPPPVTVPVLPLEAPPAPDVTVSTAGPASPQTFPAARREIRRHSKKTVEVEWVERPPSVASFLIAAVVIALMVAGLIVAAAYLR